MTEEQTNETKDFIGKKLMSIIDINTDMEIKKIMEEITGETYGDGVDDARILLFEDNTALIFIDYDCDGYRSGEWHLKQLKEMLDKSLTKGIKNINSIVKSIEFKEDVDFPDGICYTKNNDVAIITTDEYIIVMGQDNVDDYYPSNFFTVKECKDFALSELSKEVQNE